MGMLLDDESFVKDRLLGWLQGTLSSYNIQAIDSTLYRLLNQQLSQTLNASQLNLFTPILTMAQNSLLQNTPALAMVSYAIVSSKRPAKGKGQKEWWR
jgi:hypothetical protein